MYEIKHMKRIMISFVHTKALINQWKWKENWRINLKQKMNKWDIEHVINWLINLFYANISFYINLNGFT